ncbi:MAG TPA: ATP-binding protein [Bacillota bacterium]|nr:ATP-binding protein [Bacillota bacterium]
MEKINFGNSIPAFKEFLEQEPGSRMEWLRQQEWFQKLPDDAYDAPAFCRTCDGITTCDRMGTILEEGRARRCPRAYGYDVHDRLTPEYEALHDRLVNGRWEGWPVCGFEETKRHPSFTRTPSFDAAEKLFRAIREGAEPGKHQAAVIACGRNGRGKTMSGLILLAECARSGFDCYAVRFNDLIGAMKRGVDGYAAVDECYRQIVNAQVVLVDEAGKESQAGNADHTRVAIESIVDRCYRQRFLFMTSNMTAQELGKYFTSTVFSRMRFESGYCLTVEESMQSKDLRGSGL